MIDFSLLVFYLIKLLNVRIHQIEIKLSTELRSLLNEFHTPDDLKMGMLYIKKKSLRKRKALYFDAR